LFLQLQREFLLKEKIETWLSGQFWGLFQLFFLWAILGLLIGPFAILAVGLIKPAPGADQGYQ